MNSSPYVITIPTDNSNIIKYSIFCDKDEDIYRIQDHYVYGLNLLMKNDEFHMYNDELNVTISKSPILFNTGIVQGIVDAYHVEINILHDVEGLIEKIKEINAKIIYDNYMSNTLAYEERQQETACEYASDII
jgi:hypothetical protein